MIDRFGDIVHVGWPDHHSLWIEAAMSLPFDARWRAFGDIAELTGRSFAQVYDKARRIKKDRRNAALRASDITRRVMVPARAGGRA